MNIALANLLGGAIPARTDSSYDTRLATKKSAVRLKFPSIRLKSLLLFVFAVQILFFIFNILFGNIIMKEMSSFRAKPRKERNESPTIDYTDVPGWLLLRSVRSAILQAERDLSADFKVLDFDQDIRIYETACSTSGLHKDKACNISVEITLTMESPVASSDHLYEILARPLNLEECACKVSLIDESIKYQLKAKRISSFLTHVTCKNLLLSTASRVSVVLAAENSNALTGWIKEAELSEIPFHVSIHGTTEELSSLRSEIIGRVHTSRICVMVSKDNDAIPDSIVCSNLVDSEPMHRKLYVSLVVGKKSKRCMIPPSIGTKENLKNWKESCAIIGLLGVAALQGPSKHDFDYVLLQKNNYDVCEGQMTRLVQHVLSLRRAFAVVQCGWKAACLLLNRHDIGYWADILDDAAPSDSLEEILFHGSHGLNARAQRYFGNRGAMVVQTPVVQHRPDTARSESHHGPRCSEPLDSATDQSSVHEELYQTTTGCSPEIDFLSPCADSIKSVAVLQRQHLLRRLPAPRLSLAVQVLANNRPALLFRTLEQLVEQTRPQCVTIHLDGGSVRSLTDEQFATLRVAQWYAHAYGVRWRRSGDALHPSLASRLGFRRNYADAQHGSDSASTVDHLVHMTWNALAHAFDGQAPRGRCESNATVLLEDDLLPAHDLMEYMNYGLSVMQRDPKVRVVSAWNDNGFNIRPGLQCAVHRGEYFMSLGWLTTRSVYEEIAPRAAQEFWPVKRFAMNGRDDGNMSEVVLHIKSGWETPFIVLFEKQRAVALFPAVSRVTHQRSSSGYSTTADIQAQTLDPQTPRLRGHSCTFRGSTEEEYDDMLEQKIRKGRWVTEDNGCKTVQWMLGFETSQNFVIALKLTFDGYASAFKNLMLPFGLIRGYGKVRGEYKDIALVHVAHHLLILLGPKSPILNRTVEIKNNYAKFRMSWKAASSLFSCDDQFGYEPECGRAVDAQRIRTFPDSSKLKSLQAGNSFPQHLVEVIAGGPGEGCDTACSRLGSKCSEWGAIYAQMATHVRVDNMTVYHPREFVPCNKHHVYGPLLADPRPDLPIMNASATQIDSIRLGSLRLFRCDVQTSQENRRVCPCFNKTADAVYGSVELHNEIHL